MSITLAASLGKANRDFARWNKGSDADRTLWRLAMAKSCYCHFYGAGLVDWFCLTGDREVLQAAIDNCETKLDEFTHYRNFTPGKSNIGSTRGFGRGFYVAIRTWMVQPENPMLQKPVNLCRETFVNLPDEYLDERGVYAVVVTNIPDAAGQPLLCHGLPARGNTARMTVPQMQNGNPAKWGSPIISIYWKLRYNTQ